MPKITVEKLQFEGRWWKGEGRKTIQMVIGPRIEIMRLSPDISIYGPKV